MENSNKEKLRYLIERRVENISDNLLQQTPLVIGEICNAVIPNAPAIQKIAIETINKKKNQLMPKVQEYCDLLVDMATLDPDETLEDYIKNAENIINETLATMISKRTGLPEGIMKFSLDAFLSDTVIKL